MRVFIGMESSGVSRREFEAQGHTAISCDMLPADDGESFPLDKESSGHIQGDVFENIAWLTLAEWEPDFALFHPTCTLHTVSAAWAFKDPDFDRYPGVGYHQKVQPETLVGKKRRDARDEAEADLERIRLLPFLKAVENPKGTIPNRTRYGKPADILQPFEFGDDASKATCIWIFDERGEPVPFTFTRDNSFA